MLGIVTSFPHPLLGHRHYPFLSAAVTNITILLSPAPHLSLKMGFPLWCRPSHHMPTSEPLPLPFRPLVSSGLLYLELPSSLPLLPALAMGASFHHVVWTLGPGAYSQSSRQRPCQEAMSLLCLHLCHLAVPPTQPRSRISMCSTDYWEFPGSPAGRTWRSHCHGPELNPCLGS